MTMETEGSGAASADPERLRRRLRFRCWHRGTREIDLLLGRFADAELPQMNPEELVELERLLEQGDPDLYDWVVGRRPVPTDLDTDVMARLCRFHRPEPS